LTSSHFWSEGGRKGEAMKTYEEVVRKIESERDAPARAESFARFQRAVEKYRPAWPENGVILVAGSNGKGTVAKTLETLLSASGENVGLYTSPHMMETVERIRSNGQNLSHEEFIEAYSLIQPIADEFTLSHFEILTLMMIEVFFGQRIRKKVTLAVIEVGLGGRLDPTRIIPHDVSVITRLGLDHAELLGGTLHSIAREKFAIVNPGNLVMLARLEPEARRALDEIRCQVAARWIEVENFGYRVEGAFDPRWIIKTPWGESPLAMKGARAVENVSLALCTLREMGLAGKLSANLSAVSRAYWPCRMEGFLIGGKRIYLSGDHNTQGVESLKEIISRFEYSTLHLVVGIGKSKAQGEMLATFSKFPRSRLYLTSTPVRGAALEHYGNWLERASFADMDPTRVLLEALKNAKENDLVLVSGSLYLTGDLRAQLIRGEFGIASSMDEADHMIATRANLPS
jgi:dihydrofolate synthase/folylpolyglutamate synthase